MLEKNYYNVFFIAGKTLFISSLFLLWVYMCFQFSSVQSLSRVWLFATPWAVAHQSSLSITNSWNLLKLMSKESVMRSSHLIFCVPLSSCLQSFPASWSLPMSQFYASGGQSNWNFNFIISPSNEYSELISFRMDRLDILAVQGFYLDTVFFAL